MTRTHYTHGRGAPDRNNKNIITVHYLPNAIVVSAVRGIPSKQLIATASVGARVTEVASNKWILKPLYICHYLRPLGFPTTRSKKIAVTNDLSRMSVDLPSSAFHILLQWRSHCKSGDLPWRRGNRIPSGRHTGRSHAWSRGLEEERTAKK